MEKEGRTHLQMSRRTGVGYRLQVKWAEGGQGQLSGEPENIFGTMAQKYDARGREYYIMSRKIIAVSRTPNTYQIYPL